jgi:hypothetical protein
MNPLERHGIDPLSPSSLNLWRFPVPILCLEYVDVFRDFIGPDCSRLTASAPLVRVA